jgi:acetoin:2,6-dichlorophenolindophenol oxidoreductase subunit alpha
MKHKYPMGFTMEQVQPVSRSETEEALFSFQGEYTRAFLSMLLARVLEEKLAGMYRGGKIFGGVYLGKGQEALSAAIGSLLSPGDVFSPLIRDLAGRLAFGESVLDVVRTYTGSVLGPMRGREGNVHRGYPRQGMLPMISHLGAMISVVNGILMGRRFQQVEAGVGVASIGEGATSTGAFHEALNQAAIEKLPLVLVIANNQYAYSTPTHRQFACRALVDRAIGYGVEGHDLDGTCLAACLTTLRKAIAKARSGAGPQLVVGNLLRLCGHGEHDDASYVEAHLKDAACSRDCLAVSRDYLVETGWATPERLVSWTDEARRQVDSAVAEVEGEAGPDPYQEEWCALSCKHLMDSYSLPDTT